MFLQYSFELVFCKQWFVGMKCADNMGVWKFSLRYEWLSMTLTGLMLKNVGCILNRKKPIWLVLDFLLVNWQSMLHVFFYLDILTMYIGFNWTDTECCVWSYVHNKVTTHVVCLWLFDCNFIPLHWKTSVSLTLNKRECFWK